MTEQEDYLEVERNLEKSLNNIAFDFCTRDSFLLV